MPFALRRFRHSLSKTLLRAPLVWLRHRNYTPQDVYIAEYPKSGITWLTFLLFETFTGQPARFESVKRVIRDRGKALPLLPGGGRLIPTHERYRGDYKKAVYLVRDARDVVLSEYAFEKALGFFVGDFENFLTAFLRGRVNSYGAWQAHVHSWLDANLSHQVGLLVVKYEEIRRNTEGELARIVDFLGASIDRDVIRRAVTNNVLEKMREKEDAARSAVPQNGDKAPLRAMDRSFPGGGRFVRNGSMGGWRDKLSEEQVKLIAQYAGSALARLGYPLSSDGDTTGTCEFASKLQA